MKRRSEFGTVDAVPAGDRETGKHPANDPAPGEVTPELAGKFRDRDAELARDAGQRTDANTRRSSDEPLEDKPPRL